MPSGDTTTSAEQLLAAPSENTESSSQPSCSITRFLLLGYVCGVGAVAAGTFSVLALFLSNCLHLSDNTSSQLVSSYVCCYCVFGIFGALLADKTSARTVQKGGLVVWGVGLAMLCLVLGVCSAQNTDQPGGIAQALVFVALALVALGFGTQFSTLSVFVTVELGDDSGNNTSLFALSYAAMNIGDFVSAAGCPVLRQHIPSPVTSMLVVSALMLSILLLSAGLLVAGCNRQPKQEAIEFKHLALYPYLPNLCTIAKLFSPMPVYFMLFYQQSSTWDFQADNLLDSNTIDSFEIPPDAMPAVNDIIVVASLFVLDRIVYPKLVASGWPCLPLSRMACGIFSAALAFLCATILEYLAKAAKDGGYDKPSILWQLPQYLFISVAEALVGASGLELAYNEAPAELRSFVTSMWLMSSALGQGLVIMLIASVGSGSVSFFLVCTSSMIFVGIGFLFLTNGFQYKSY